MESNYNITAKAKKHQACSFEGVNPGSCKRGDNCPFSHDRSLLELFRQNLAVVKKSKIMRQEAKVKTVRVTRCVDQNASVVCSFAVDDKCTRPNCKHSHDPKLIQAARDAKAKREVKKLEDYANKLADEVCSFAVDGKCTHHDCRRSHDPKLIQVARDAKAKRDAKKLEDYANNLAGVLCKFEVNGSCRFGKSCKFSHDSEKIQAARDAKAEYEKFVELQRKINNLFIK
jgi:hypothetical protein